MDTTNKPFSSFETRLLIGAAAAAVAIVGGAVWYTQASASPATVVEAPAAPVEPAPAPETPAGPFMPDLVGMDVAEAQAELRVLGIASTATDTCVVNACHTAIVECNDGNGGWIDVRDTGAEKIGEQEFEPGTDLAGVTHVDLISFDYCPLGAYEHPVVDVEPEMPAEPEEPVVEPKREAPFMPAPTPEPIVEPTPEPAPEEPIVVEPVEEDADEDDVDEDEDDDTAEEPVEDDDEDDTDDAEDADEE